MARVTLRIVEPKTAMSRASIESCCCAGPQGPLPVAMAFRKQGEVMTLWHGPCQLSDHSASFTTQNNHTVYPLNSGAAAESTGIKRNAVTPRLAIAVMAHIGPANQIAHSRQKLNEQLQYCNVKTT